ncbi:unnamed protein product [Cladocopium goreaui]|uniref:Long-chain-fatty-acid--CoA ligase 4 n=1 Tax=Cladocopium goreaui TaxID=2562237 RepID=A0A9P1FMP4_9DINO|nr:unnamed protein product [Cladocopium goreaui]
MSCKDTMQSERCCRYRLCCWRKWHLGYLQPNCQPTQISTGAETKVEKSGPVVAFLFKLAMRIKKSAVRQNLYTPLFDLLVFKKFKSMLGGSGGGAISPDVQEWVRTAFGCPLIQGYGLTETCGGAVLQKPLADPSVGFVGSVLSSVELTLHSEYGHLRSIRSQARLNFRQCQMKCFRCLTQYIIDQYVIPC